MADTEGGQWLTIEKAAAALERSSRTIRRMAKDGRLPSRTQGGRVLVDVSGFVPQKAEESDTATLQSEIKDLRNQIKELMTEIDRLRDLVDRQDAEILFLRNAHVAALRLQQAAIEAPTRRWRWPWDRGED